MKKNNYLKVSEITHCPECNREYSNENNLCNYCNITLIGGTRTEEERNEAINKQKIQSEREDEIIGIIYKIGAYITGIIFFIGIWIYALTQWGLLIGLVIGWLPAIIGAYLAGFLWPLIVLGIVVLIIIGLKN